jgi:hypothetical protein
MFESVNQTTNWDNGNLPLPPSPHLFPGAAKAHKHMAPVVEGMADDATTMHPQGVPSSTAAASAAKAGADEMPGSAAAADNASTNPSEVSRGEGSSIGDGRGPQHSNEAHSTAAVTSATAQPDSATIVSSHLQTAGSAGSGRRTPHYDGGDMAVDAGALQPQNFIGGQARGGLTSSTAGQVPSSLNRRLGSQGSAASDITPIAPASLGVQVLQMESPPTSSDVDLTRMSGSSPRGIRRMQQ